MCNLVPGRDYMAPTPLEVVFPEETQSSSDSRCTTLSTIDDDDYEENHQFTVELRVISNDSIITLGSPSVSTITIQDNFGTLLSLAFQYF